MILPEIKVFKHEVFEDYRGELYTLWNQEQFYPKLNFNHDKISTSRKNVLRGLHGDNKSWKLVSCLHGEMYFVVVNNDPKSKQYLQHQTFILSGKKRESVLLPPLYANGFLVLSEEVIFHYKWAYEGNYPDVEDQFSLNWMDPKLNITWPVNNPILSLRDANSSFL